MTTRAQVRWAGPLLAASMLLGAGRAQAQPPGQDTAAKDEPDVSAAGLPPKIEWRFNFDATWGTFGFANSLYQNPHEGVPENLSDQWFEGSMKPALSGNYTFSGTSQMYGKLSAVGERTYGAAPSLVGSDFSSFQVEDLAIGWRSGKSLPSLGENAVDFVVGRVPFTIGHGMLLLDGAAEGGSRGGYWTNARKAFQFATVGRFKPGHLTLEGFYLDKDELPEHDTGTRLWGANGEYAFGEHSTVGATYMKFFAHQDVDAARDELNVFNARAYLAPISSFPDLTVDFEYAAERNGDLRHSNAWTAQGAYELGAVSWKPKFSYRYASFEGDDPATKQNEAFDPLLPGFSDWGSWWQGEIAGEYLVSNSNLISHQFRAHVAPSDAVGAGLIFYKFLLDQPRTYAPGVTASDLMFEMDAYTDWKINKNFTASLVGAFGDPQTAAQQAFNRTQDFAYGMVFIAYAY